MEAGRRGTQTRLHFTLAEWLGCLTPISLCIRTAKLSGVFRRPRTWHSFSSSAKLPPRQSLGLSASQNSEDQSLRDSKPVRSETKHGNPAREEAIEATEAMNSLHGHVYLQPGPGLLSSQGRVAHLSCLTVGCQETQDLSGPPSPDQHDHRKSF